MTPKNKPTCRQFKKEEWADFKAIRLTSLQTDPYVFGRSYAEEKDFTQEDWENWITNKSGACFGLFDGSSLIGCTGIITDRHDPSGETAVLIASFILPEYRGQGLSDLLYKTRIDYAQKRNEWKKIVVAHRAGNEASKRANQRHGFMYTHSELESWPDGKMAEKLFYAQDLNKLRAHNPKGPHSPTI
jgi:RimJ/RimL family protein N-acetyltransferase